MSDTTEQLRGIADNATTGPWRAADGGSFGGWWISRNGDPALPTICAVQGRYSPNVEFIEKSDPVVVAVMLDVVEAAERLTDELRQIVIDDPPTEVELTAVDAALARFEQVAGDPDGR